MKLLFKRNRTVEVTSESNVGLSVGEKVVINANKTEVNTMSLFLLNIENQNNAQRLAPNKLKMSVMLLLNVVSHMVYPT